MIEEFLIGAVLVPKEEKQIIICSNGLIKAQGVKMLFEDVGVNVSISEKDLEDNVFGYVVHSPDNESDKWFISEDYTKKHYTFKTYKLSDYN